MSLRQVYLDTTIISRLVDLERGVRPSSHRLQEDMAVLPQVLSLCLERGGVLCTSQDARSEIERLKAKRSGVRDALLRELERFALVPTRHSAVGVRGDLPLDSLVAEIEGFLLEKTQATNRLKVDRVRRDARHLAVSWDSGCDVFLTTDYASLWAYRRGLKERFGLRVLRPVELWKELAGR